MPSPTHTCLISPHSTDSQCLPIDLVFCRGAGTWAEEMQIEVLLDL